MWNRYVFFFHGFLWSILWSPHRPVVIVSKLHLHQYLCSYDCPLLTILLVGGTGENVAEIVARLKRDMLPTTINGLIYWPMCDFITFKFIPVRLQVPLKFFLLCNEGSDEWWYISQVIVLFLWLIFFCFVLCSRWPAIPFHLFGMSTSHTWQV